MQGEDELYAVGRPPELGHGDPVFGEVAGVLGDSVLRDEQQATRLCQQNKTAVVKNPNSLVVARAAHLDPVDGVPTLGEDELLAGVVSGEVHHGHVNKNIEQDHLSRVDHAGLVLELLGEGQLAEGVHCGEPDAVLGDHDEPLEASKVAGPKDHKESVAFPVNCGEVGGEGREPPCQCS